MRESTPPLPPSLYFVLAKENENSAYVDAHSTREETAVTSMGRMTRIRVVKRMATSVVE